MKTTGESTTKTSPMTKGQTLIQYIEKCKGQIEMALPKHITVDRIARIAQTTIRKNPKLALCTINSVMGAIMESAQLGLELNTPLGLAYLIPYEKKGIMEAQFQIGYKGVIELAYRAKIFACITAFEVYKNDHFEYSYGLNAKLEHIPAHDQEGEAILYYAYYKTKDGGFDYRVWSRKKVLEHAKKYSKSWDVKHNDFKFGSAWRDNFDSQAKKTVLLDALKYAPKSVEIAQVLEINDSTRHLNLDTMTIDGDYSMSESEDDNAEIPETVDITGRKKKEEPSQKASKKEASIFGRNEIPFM